MIKAEVIGLRDFPFFATSYGVASLVLNQIPYTSSAYIRIQSAADGEKLLSECVDFCRAAGAERIFATGHPVCEQFQSHTQIIKMTAPVSSVGETDASLFPVTEETLEKWREIYNRKIRSIPNASYMSIKQAKEFRVQCSMYFIHRDAVLLGIGMVDGNALRFVASLRSGAGQDAVRGLCHSIADDFVELEVATANTKAVSLYERLGFVPSALVATWYQII